MTGRSWRSWLGTALTVACAAAASAQDLEVASSGPDRGGRPARGGARGARRLLRAHGHARAHPGRRPAALLQDHARRARTLPLVGDTHADLHAQRPAAPAARHALRRDGGYHGDARGGPPGCAPTRFRSPRRPSASSARTGTGRRAATTRRSCCCCASTSRSPTRARAPPRVCATSRTFALRRCCLRKAWRGSPWTRGRRPTSRPRWRARRPPQATGAGAGLAGRVLGPEGVSARFRPARLGHGRGAAYRRLDPVRVGAGARGVQGDQFTGLLCRLTLPSALRSSAWARWGCPWPPTSPRAAGPSGPTTPSPSAAPRRPGAGSTGPRARPTRRPPRPAPSS